MPKPWRDSRAVLTAPAMRTSFRDTQRQMKSYVDKRDVIATADLPAADASQDGKIIIEDAGAGDRNLIIYAGGQRFRIDGGAAI